MIRIVKVSLVLLLHLGMSLSANAQGRILSDGVAGMVGVGSSMANGTDAFGYGASVFYDGVEAGIQHSGLNLDFGGDDVSTVSGYIVGYVTRPSEADIASIAVGSFAESIQYGRRSATVIGLQVSEVKQLYNAGNTIIAPNINVVTGIFIKEDTVLIHTPIYTSVSFSLGLAYSFERRAYVVFDPLVVLSGQNASSVVFGALLNVIVPFWNGD